MAINKINEIFFKIFSIVLLMIAMNLLFILSLNAQQTVTIFFDKPTDSVKSCQAPYEWTVNGMKLTNQNKQYEIPVNIKEFDTIQLTLEGSKTRTILAQFTPNHKYRLFPAGCCHDIEIYDEKNYIRLDSLWRSDTLMEFEKKWYLMDSIRNAEEIGQVKFLLKNAVAIDSIVGTFGDIDRAIGMTSGDLLKPNQIVTSTGGFMTGESNLCFEILIGKIKGNPGKNDFQDDSPRYFLYIPKREMVWITELFHEFEYRFFNRETLLVEYDYLTKNLKLSIE